MNERSYYGVVFPEFWTGRTGLELRRHRDAQLLALYLASNRHANMIGLYRITVDDVRHETGLTARALEKGFAVCAATNYATYDAASAVVWVPQMARIRLGLGTNGNGRLAPDDKRVVAVNRIYHALPENPFLELFYKANKSVLCLKSIRKVETALVVPYRADHKMSPFQGASKGLGSQRTEYRSRDQRSEIR